MNYNNKEIKKYKHYKNQFNKKTSLSNLKLKSYNK
jgi:hypothetical protein